MYSLSPRIIKRPEGDILIFLSNIDTPLFFGGEGRGLGGGSFKISIFRFSVFSFFFFFVRGGGQKNVSLCVGGCGWVCGRGGAGDFLG